MVYQVNFQRRCLFFRPWLMLIATWWRPYFRHRHRPRSLALQDSRRFVSGNPRPHDGLQLCI